MAVQEIVIGADSPVLRTETLKITQFDKELKKLIGDLLDTVEHAKGAGLAAPQIAVTSRVCVARIRDEFVPLVNPEILWQSDIVTQEEEGCLSLPDVWLYIPRPTEIVLRYADEKGKEQERKLEGWDARVVQHELDHLHGKLIVDYHAAGAEVPGEAL
jgi:peptide deformylase